MIQYLQQSEEFPLLVKSTIDWFGSFDVRDRAERKGRDFQTGEEIIIPATSKCQDLKLVKHLKKLQIINN